MGAPPKGKECKLSLSQERTWCVVELASTSPDPYIVIRPTKGEGYEISRIFALNLTERASEDCA